jgi:hypothetical protein
MLPKVELTRRDMPNVDNLLIYKLAALKYQMNKQIRYRYIMAITLGIVSITLFTNSDMYAAAFEPVPFNKIPPAIINSKDDKHEFTADYSLDFADETQIRHDDDAKLASNMKLDKDDDRLSVEVKCDSNDICDTSLSPREVTVYLVDRGTKDGQIARNSIPQLELKKNDCGSHSIEDCAHFDFDIPDDILTKKYKLVVDMVFDEAEWIFINPVRITN